MSQPYEGPAETSESEALSLLGELGEHLDWDVGELWSVAESGELSCAAVWHRASYAAMGASARKLVLSPGAGAPGLALKTGRPVWITDVTRESTLFIRADVARQLGLQTACAFPVSGGGGMKAVVLFMSRRRRPPDTAAIRACEAAADRFAALASQSTV